jgi:type I restriction-modification system DNA methylase subunit
MNNGTGNLNWIANFIWGIADYVLRDVYVRGKYRDVILPMTVIRRFDAVLEPNKIAVLDMKKQLDEAGIALPAACDTETLEECTDLLDAEAAQEDQEMQEELPAEDY